MIISPQSHEEAGRLEALRRYEILDTAPEQALDDLAALAAHICEAPMSLITFIDEDRQWFKSRVGVPFGEAPRAMSFCTHTLASETLYIVPDAASDARFVDNPFVASEPNIRFYAGAPLMSPSGYALGTLCILDVRPRDLSLAQQEALRVLSRQVMSQLELRRQARELAASEDRLLTVFRNTPVALAIHRWSDRTYVDVNAAFTQLLGWTRADVFGKTNDDLNLVASVDSAKVRARLASHNAMRDMEMSVHARSGEVREVLVGSELLDLHGERHTITTFVDVTERNHAEARYRTLFDYARVGIVVATPDSHYLDVNASMCQMLGYSREEFIGLHASRIVAPADAHQVNLAVEAIKAHKDYEGAWKFRRKNGELFDAEVIATEMPGGNRLGMIRDITERKRTEARFRRLVDSNAQGVMFWDLAGDITDANDAFLRTVGHSRDDLQSGKLNWVAMTPSEYVDADRLCMDTLASHGSCAPYEKEFIRKDGSRVPVLIGAASFEDSESEGVCFIVDLTERKKLEQQFLRAQRMESVGTLAGGIAHDLNNVFAPILMSIEMLREMVEVDDGFEILGTLKSSAQRGAALVQQVLSFARGVEGERITVSPLALMRDLLSVMRDTFPKSIDVRFTPAADLWSLTGDPTQVHQVLLNLCVNARDAMPEGGTLSIAMENVVVVDSYAAMNPDGEPGAYVMMKVMDTGTGIAPTVRERIFEPFFTTKDLGQGTGLGLSTTMAIVKSHGGFIHVYSEGSTGTTFKVYLPANTSELAAQRVAADRTNLPRGDGQLVLVVDDEDAIRKIVQGTLQRFGYQVLLAVNGAEAVALYAQRRAEIDVVLTDMAMPVMDGPATIIALKSINPKVRIIGSSGLASSGAVARAVGAGVIHFIPKPYTAETMLKELHSILSDGGAKAI